MTSELGDTAATVSGDKLIKAVIEAGMINDGYLLIVCHL